MSVDLSKIKPGDEVLIRLSISAVNANGIWAAGEAWHPADSLNLRGIPEQIVGHTPKALAVGDRVRGPAREPATIVAIHDQWAWAVSVVDPYPHALIPLAKLERVDPVDPENPK